MTNTSVARCKIFLCTYEHKSNQYDININVYEFLCNVEFLIYFYIRQFIINYIKSLVHLIS